LAFAEHLIEEYRMRTAAVKRLVTEVLASLPLPHTEDVIEDVFYAVEQRADWQKRYNALCAELGKTVTNNWFGFWTANLEERRASEQVAATKTRLIATYSKLIEPAATPRKKIKEADALGNMAAYFQEHKANLPTAIRKHRETLVELLMAGISAEDAFATVVSNGA
jgi:hypothetical protein